MATYNSEQTWRMREMHGAPLASFWRRAAAFVLDIVILSVLFVVVGALLAPFLVKRGWVAHSDKIVFALNANWYSVAWVVLYFGLATYIGRGQTPGKRLLDIRVVSLAHERISLWHSLERALGYGASMLEFGFGFVQYFIHPNKRTVHDRIADTIVVRDPRRKTGARRIEKKA
ncbi:MAG: RDD family protein [Acidobacteria bacterium]|nr:RDD family protein [Acidobacteriota bacterium]